MRLSEEQCWARLAASDHGVLATSRGRGIESVPICFVVVDDAASGGTMIASPIDRVKAKDTTELSRRANVERNPRAALLCEHWDRNDWSQLWWVRAQLLHRWDPEVDRALAVACEHALRDKYVQYRDSDFADVMVFDVTSVVGWSALSEPQSETADPLM